MKNSTPPFKFLDAYQKNDSKVFFGRDKEANDLYDALSGMKHLLVYGPSGAGKTSLIECGLRNQFSNADWFAMTIRRNTNLVASVFQNINQILNKKIDLDSETKFPKEKTMNFGKAIENLFDERYQPIYLLFDQFEELLILGTKEEKEDFFRQLNDLIHYQVPCRVLLIMREEFIGHLSEWEYLCPSIFQHRFRLEKMNRTNVKSVIANTLAAPQYTASFEVENVEKLTNSILAKLPDEKKEIELTHVQVFLSQLWKRADEKKEENTLPKLHEGLITDDDDLEGVLDVFLKEQLAELNTDFGEKNPLELLVAMISERHTKLQLSERDIITDFNQKNITIATPKIKELLVELRKRGIIRNLKANDETKYEISHDRLALVIGQNLTTEMKMREEAGKIYRVYLQRPGLFSMEDLDYLRPYERYFAYPKALEEQIKKSEISLDEQQLVAQKKQKNKIRFLVVISSVLFALATYAFYQKNQVEIVSFESDLLYADKLKEQGLYEDANQFLHFIKERYESDQEKQTTISAKIVVVDSVASQLNIIDDLFKNNNFSKALSKIQHIRTYSTDNFLEDKEREIREIRDKKIKDIASSITDRYLGDRTEASIEIATDQYLILRKYQPETQFVNLKNKIEQNINEGITDKARKKRLLQKLEKSYSLGF